NQPLTAARALARSVQHLLHDARPDLARAGANTANLITQIDHTADVVRHMRHSLRRSRTVLRTIEVRELLIAALVLAGPKAESRAVSIVREVAGDLPPIQGDAVQLQQVVLNLLSNAVEAIAHAGMPIGRIDVSARRSEMPARIEIAIRDNGPGVSAH